jgi:hypothetical protein
LSSSVHTHTHPLTNHTLTLSHTPHTRAYVPTQPTHTHTHTRRPISYAEAVEEEVRQLEQRDQRGAEQWPGAVVPHYERYVCVCLKRVEENSLHPSHTYTYTHRGLLQHRAHRRCCVSRRPEGTKEAYAYGHAHQDHPHGRRCAALAPALDPHSHFMFKVVCVRGSIRNGHAH